MYLSSMYWSLTMLMKTPYIGPDTLLEKVFGCLMVVLGAFMFAVLLGNIIALIKTFEKRGSTLRSRSQPPMTSRRSEGAEGGGGRARDLHHDERRLLARRARHSDVVGAEERLSLIHI